MSEINDIMMKIRKFRQERNWESWDNGKDLALSISLEAAELLELYQWRTAEEGNQDRERLKEEIADVLIYTLTLADHLELSVPDIIDSKLRLNAIKYPINKKD